ncbi:MAG: hypothetical protein FOGNACKC_02292 [Anaerolineae bacterium]|nr:hypothetical protein [Anaerolineae bacterium]
MTGKAKTNLYLDLVLFMAFLIATEPAATGMAIHEWLGLALGATLFTHLLLHWKWVIAVLKRFFQPLVWQARFNFILNTALLTTFALVIISGVMISKELGLAQLLGLESLAGAGWRGIHDAASNVSLALVGVHVAVHWRWLVDAFKRYVLRQGPKKITAGQRPQPLSKKLSEI